MGAGFGLVIPPCPPPPGLKTPPAPPDSTSPYLTGIVVTTDEPNVCGLWVTCVETGVTFQVQSAAAKFYATSTANRTFKTSGGPGGYCPSQTGHTFSSGSTTAAAAASPGISAFITVTQTG